MVHNPAQKASEEALAEIKKCIDENLCFRLEAGAGAGKTFSLIESIKYLLISRADQLMKNQQRIACITYTNVAKQEIKDRTDNHPVIFSDTIHAFCWNILKTCQVMLRKHMSDLGEKWQRRIVESGGIFLQKVGYELGFPAITERDISLHHDDVIALMARMLCYPKFQKIIKSKFPIILIDEYQDTNINLANSIVTNVIDNDSGILVGLFGDHWQKIYGSDACGLILSEKNKIIEIGKKANFRSDKNIVHCLNRMRPVLKQAEADPNSGGAIKIYHSNFWEGARRDGKGGGHWTGDLPEAEVKAHLERVKELMVKDGWDMEPKKTKILFLTNNLIASEKGFKNLADCYQYADEYLKKSDRYIEFFLDFLEPVMHAFEKRDYGELFRLLKKSNLRLKSQDDKKSLSEKLNHLMDMRERGNVDEVLALISTTKIPGFTAKLVASEERYADLLMKKEILEETLDEKDEKFIFFQKKLRRIEYKEIINLGSYIDEKTPFSTKHGVKGAEFDNVLVIFGRGWNQYNWNQMLEWMVDGCPEDKKESFERNRNLFYVSCSRAKHNLTLLFTQLLSDKAISELERIFSPDNILGNPFSIG